MNYPSNSSVFRQETGVLATNKVLRNTYALLALTLLFSAATAGIAMMLNMPPLHWIITLVGYYGLLFLTMRLRNSALGLVSVFALTGFMGLTLGPIISHFVRVIPNGGQLVMMAMGGTGAIFLALSTYTLVSRKDFSFMGGMITGGVLVGIVLSLAAMFFHLPGLSLAVSAMFILLMSGAIMWETSNIIHGGETNYIMATISLYVSIYNLFLSLLQLLGVFGSDE